MVMKPRKIVSVLERELLETKKRIIFLWGPRQVGKSTVLNHLYQKFGGCYFNFDDLLDQRLFVPELASLKMVLNERTNNKTSKYIFIDEIQNHSQATVAMKILADQTDYVILATGSSELRAKTQQFDSLAGRYLEHVLFPLTIDEVDNFTSERINFVAKPNFAQNENLKKYLENILTYGSYPGVVLSDNKALELKNITQNSIIKDIVNIYDLKNTDLVFNLLRLLAMQVGNLVNISSIVSELGSTKLTIDNYLSILEKNRVIYFLPPYRTNKRRGFLAKKKVYFYDLGIRNSLIEDFRPTNVRTDLGAMFENLVVMGAFRQSIYSMNFDKLYYYRDLTGAQKEIDLIIENLTGNITGFEIKYNGGTANKFPELNISKYETISKENVSMFLT